MVYFVLTHITILWLNDRGGEVCKWLSGVCKSFLGGCSLWDSMKAGEKGGEWCRFLAFKDTKAEVLASGACRGWVGGGDYY